MNLNLFLIQFVLFTSCFMLLQSRRLPHGWLAVTGIILGGLGTSFLTLPEWAGLISSGLWVVLVLLPLVGFAQINRLVMQERYQAARQIATWVKWLHPADGFVEYPHLLQGLELGQRGQFDQARQLLSRYQTNSTATGRMATVMLYQMNADWRGLVDWIEAHVADQTLYREMGLVTAYLRSLGELGKLNELLQGVEQFEQRVGRGGNPTTYGTVKLYALAFCGQVESVKRLLDRVLSIYPAPIQQFWIATAELIAGRDAIAREMLTSIRMTQNGPLEKAIDWRLSVPRVDPLQVLTESSHRILQQLNTTIAQELRYTGWGSLAPRKSYATYGLIGINVFVYGLSKRLGSSEDLYVLYRLGALVPEVVFAGEWWRSLTATFLHSGELHLVANMLGLYVFGGLVEATLGYKKFLTSYLFCGVGSMLAVAIIAKLTEAPTQITVGASGAVLGMVGVEAAIQFKGWWFGKAKIARERLRLIILVLVLQLMSDLITPQVSIVGHLSGVILGFLAGLILFKPKRSFS